MPVELAAEHFPRFFRAVRGYDPFPWQERLVRRLAAGEAWPSALALPTGAGKTSAIDVAVFSLALALARGDRPRRAPMRIVFVVDRRIIVDAAFAAATQIQAALNASDDDAVAAVRDALRRTARPGFPPLHVARLRGGAPREADWTPSPAHPTVLLSTVDQVGSRLLFRGYGVSESMRPVHAGLLGQDALVLLDEVHLSEPFRQTLRTIGRLTGDDVLPWHVVELSATPRVRDDDTFRLDEADRSDTTLHMRLAAAKPVQAIPGNRGEEHLAAQFADWVLRATPLFGASGRRVLVVVNRIDRARLVYEELQRRVPSEEVHLLIGRTRDTDRSDAVRRILARASTRTGTPDPDEPLFFLVATQTVEAGADLDFDAVVTEIAPLDALRQRFGRLDRAGWATRAGRTPFGLVIGPPEEVAKGARDPVYGEALRRTWEWFRDCDDAAMDFGIDAMDERWRALDEATQAELTSPADDAPILMPSHVRLLEQTRPTPEPSPAIDLWLHGPRKPSDVSVVWRADIPPPSATNVQLEERLSDLLDAVPPRVGEALQLPVWIVKRWLIERDRPSAGMLADIGDVTEEEPADGDIRSRRPAAWRWSRVKRAVEAVSAEQVRPGDLLIVPASYGGCDHFGWNPRFRDTVRDVAEQAARPYRASSDAVRLHRDLLRQELTDAGGSPDDAEVRRLWQRFSAPIGTETTAAEAVRAALDAGVFPEDGATRAALERLQRLRPGDLTLATYPDEDGDAVGWIIAAPRGSLTAATAPDAGPDLDPTTEDDERGALSDGPYTLRAHGVDVERHAREAASALGLPDRLVNDLALAGHLHDVGKADPRFQEYLLGSRWMRYADDDAEPLAKSIRPRDRASDRLARRAARLPDRWRHEALSVRVALDHPAFADASDPELVLWLIGVHHGWGRPFFPHADPLENAELPLQHLQPGLRIEDRRGPQSAHFVLPVVAEGGVFQATWPRLRSRVSARYGPWRTALFEGIVRLADHRASAEQRARQREVGA